MKNRISILLIILAALIAAIYCAKGPIVRPPYQPPTEATQPDTAARMLPIPPDTLKFLPLTLKSIYFDNESDSINRVAAGILNDNGQSLMRVPTATIRIEGNCDEIEAQHNPELARLRAEAAKGFLVNIGIESIRITAISRGSNNPIDTAHTEAAYAKNRRDDIVVVSQ